MGHREQSRKATGSSDRGRPHHRSGSSASQHLRPYEQPQGSPCSEDSRHAATRHVSPSSEHGLFPAPTRRLSEQPEAPSRQLSEQAAARRYSEISRVESPSASPLKKKSSGSSSSDSWDLLEQDEGPAALDSSALPSYNFPGTWPAAFNDTTTALTQIGSATASYASALTRSGIGKAGWSVGAALASTANRRALSLVDWAAGRTGTGEDNLPRPIGRWLKGGRKTKEERRRAERKKKEKEARRARGDPSPEASDDNFESPLFKDDEGPFTLETSEMNNAGDFVDGQRAVQMEEEEEEEDDRGFTPATTTTIGGRAVERHGRSSLEGYEEDEVEDDGMKRLFQYDD
ncbi:hypothetical protein HBH56_047840 [Parastagonospora nodorum]|uniref:Uncharacterized protein n=2 Tax=Phaeosphaeria nodorum (strain SN15 / ATCC MYA-4574 / FGSC 10173) TaxID=321614 RepID=A0A7U2ET45_PHANO|nr:hypothetical protein SNOG_08432 [Parastagonospora nodorum SN15]KAH3918014.1 hypothetical protein HBH56_047840 [Parastagonospora nodorum]EAT84708.2 hypothetical protein SNOG_08432 [Parastagonospora nodorum SN15]KAH3932881.1 hypothetical protein HBH54_075580 [Parastagonospora nodorum]KAH4124525.1 hypothetical protein HBH45_238320 [Parastagonospora nodorum]KAH4169097.1 hypothetical protein HBH44_048510 [Parastagonospora nodorum]